MNGFRRESFESRVTVVVVDTSATGGSFSAEQTVYILYIALAGADLILVLLSIFLLFGVEPVNSFAYSVCSLQSSNCRTGQWRTRQ